jgi:Leucine-rich repeat (LRR) protein
MKILLLVILVAFAVAGVGWWNVSESPSLNRSAIEQKEDIPTVSLEQDKVENTNGTVLDLSGKGLTKVPESVFTQTGVTELNLSNNQLTGALQAEVRLLQNLKVLDLSDNQFTGVPAEVGQLSELKQLNLSNNQLTGLPHEIANLKGLETLDLRGNNPSEPDLEIIKSSLLGTTILLDT